MSIFRYQILFPELLGFNLLQVNEELQIAHRSTKFQTLQSLACCKHQEPYNPRPYLMEFRKYPGIASGLGAEYFYRDDQRSLLSSPRSLCWCFFLLHCRVHDSQSMHPEYIIIHLCAKHSIGLCGQARQRFALPYSFAMLVDCPIELPRSAGHLATGTRGEQIYYSRTLNPWKSLESSFWILFAVKRQHAACSCFLMYSGFQHSITTFYLYEVRSIPFISTLELGKQPPSPSPHFSRFAKVL